MPFQKFKNFFNKPKIAKDAPQRNPNVITVDSKGVAQVGHPIELNFNKKSLKLLRKLKKEDAVPVNNVGGGQVAGLGVGPQGEPGVLPNKKKHETLTRKNPLNISRKISVKPKKFMLP